MRVLVCGGRNFDDVALLEETLDNLTEIMRRPDFVPDPISHIICGGAVGADLLAEQWADDREKPYTVYPAQWRKHGKSAGPIRNQQMLVEGKPDLVVAFPGGNGTADMVARSKKAGVRVYEVRP